MSGIGILGGTFNPVHNGHLRHALEAGEALNLSRVLLLPCAEPPHKGVSNLLPFELRVKMLKAAVASIPLLDVDTLEGEIARPSYTWRTLEEWRRRRPLLEGELYFMMGAESFAALPRWRRGLELPHFAHLVMLPRDGEDGRVFTECIQEFWPGSLEASHPYPTSRETVTLASGGKCTFLPAPRLDISATFIRERWHAGRSVAGLMPEPALRVLSAHADDVRRVWP